MTNKTTVARPAILFAGMLMATLALAGCRGGDDAGMSTAGPTGTAGGTGTGTGTDTGAGTAAPREVATGLGAPWSVAFQGSTILVSERDTARIVAIDAAGTVTPLATLAAVDGAGEGGLLGIATRDGYLYAYFTAGAENRIERYRLTGDGAALRLGSAERILGGIPAAGIHNGGRLAFGPDGMLYASTGDAGTTSRAQDLSSLGGKILRLTPTGGVPADNPFSGSYVYSYGHRNPQGLAFGPDGTLYASEFGQNTWDELNVIRPGANYGWPVVEGRANDPRFVDPVQQWTTATASPSGMAVQGSDLYIANLRGARLRRIPLASPGQATELYVGTYGRLRDAVLAPDGRLLVLTNNTDGRGTPRAGDDRLLSIPVP